MPDVVCVVVSDVVGVVVADVVGVVVTDVVGLVDIVVVTDDVCEVVTVVVNEVLAVVVGEVVGVDSEQEAKDWSCRNALKAVFRSSTAASQFAVNPITAVSISNVKQPASPTKSCP